MKLVYWLVFCWKRLFVYLIFTIAIILVMINAEDDGDETTTEKTFKSCREKMQLIGSDKNEQFEILEVEINETLILECHYCDENENNEPKNWFTLNPKNLTFHEVSIDMHKNETLNRISVSFDHELIIHHINEEDYGTYFCRNLQEGETENFLNYIVEISYNKTKKILRGNMEDWKQYHNDYIVPLNKKILTSKKQEILFLRQNLSTNFEIITHWEIKYRPCEVCGRPQGDGIQEKYGYCRIKIENNETNLSNMNISEKRKNKLEYLLHLPQVSCRSHLLQTLFPVISEATYHLSDFILVKKCSAICNPDASGVNRGWKFGSSKNYKYRRTMVLKEGEHLALVCPESNLDNKIIWRRNGKVIKQSETDEKVDVEKNVDKIHIVVDAFNSLYLLHVTPEEAGNYTCQVDKILMQQIIIYVKSHSRLLTEAFLRHMMYLAVVLVLSCSCYMAGCVAACAQRHKLKGYEEVVNLI